jgi:hypothetical protein
LHPAREGAASLAAIRRGISQLCFASQYQQNPTSLEQIKAIEAERDRRRSHAYESGDYLTFGRLWHNRITGTPEHEITDDQAMASYHEFQAIAERLEREI